MPTEIHTYVGGGTGYPFDGFAGFRIGRTYQLTYTREFDEVRLMLDHHEHMSTGAGPLVVAVEQFEWRVRE